MGIRTTIHGNKKKWDSKNDSWKPLVANLQVDLVDIVDENGRDSDDFSWASRGNRHQYHQCYHHLTSLTHQRLPYHWRHKTWNRVIRRLQNSQIRPLTLIVYSQFWRCCLKNIPKTYLTFYPRKQSWTWKITVIIIIGVLSWFHFSTPLHSNRYRNVPSDRKPFQFLPYDFVPTKSGCDGNSFSRISFYSVSKKRNRNDFFW